ncbi:50S ribosomal protein L11 methyltransferase [Notoacmeibacter sp. MSK16QG-6]|uniref:50S ribosomal protein L11 methyltransferase n=1 Tax=Notoacmeibacter sp. MSK16QG-6 TaxID=2957982 RepID=UPI00209DA40C|nr:50S ribosomal protein L11 methyltransferase [Notoacmeibacter sp. MSK16QG-6]MCP1199686.1 50S ribosomal protein L11 methyltransferase [Notoacmeibacter sp. MSK16QG-6]
MTCETCRLYLTAPRHVAEAAYEWACSAFEDEGYAVVIQEIDEDEQIFETSVYPLEDAEATASSFQEWIDRNAAGADLRTEIFRDVDWVSRSLEGLKPVHSKRITVHGRHDRAAVKPGQIGVEIEAGQAFGTGHHGTTTGCLIMLQEILRAEQPRSVLDLGTGSAVLAIAAAKLSPVAVLATDIDAVAIEVARHNVRLNGVQNRVRCQTATGFDHVDIRENAPFDLIVANILAGPLKQLALQMTRYIRPGGSILLSGILDEQRQSVIAAYSGQSFRHIRTVHREGWSTLHLKR